jgi:hypothetical protein
VEQKTWNSDVIFHAKIGLFPREKATAQKFQLNVKLACHDDLALAKVARLWPTSEALADDCAWLLRRRHCRLLETAAAGLYAYVWHACQSLGVTPLALETTLAKVEALNGIGTPAIRLKELVSAPEGHIFQSPDFVLLQPKKLEALPARHAEEGVYLKLETSGYLFANPRA